MPVSQEIGVSIPNNTEHAVLVSLPTWALVVGYEEGDKAVVDKMSCGYPRFFVHKVIQRLAAGLEQRYGRGGEKAMVFPLIGVAKDCRAFIRRREPEVAPSSVRVVRVLTPPPRLGEDEGTRVEITIGVVFFPELLAGVAKQYWQHTGMGILLRMAEYALNELDLCDQQDGKESATFVEEKFGRNLDFRHAAAAKQMVRERLSSSIAPEVKVEDVFLYPTGMASIYNAHVAALAVGDALKEAVCFGFPYTDTLSCLRKWGAGCEFLGFGDDALLDKLAAELAGGKRIVLLFCECPLNPLLRTPDLKRIRALADEYGFLVVVDETVGNFSNIHVLPFADIVVLSLTKVFSGDLNVMGGLLVLNLHGPFYQQLVEYFGAAYEDVFWVEDAIYLERNSRDFERRSQRINANLELVVAMMVAHPLVKAVYYPLELELKHHYDAVKRNGGGYGGLLLFVFHDPRSAVAFYDTVQLLKGPLLGTNFSIICPYAILAHYQELDEVERWGVDRNIIRLSVGLEEQDELMAILGEAMDAAAAAALE